MYFKIGDVADLLGETQSTLRFWEKEFGEFPGFISGKNLHGTRRYSQQNIENLKMIVFLLREKKMTIEGAKQYLRVNRRTKSNEDQLIDYLKDVRSYVENQISALDIYISNKKRERILNGNNNKNS